MELLAPAGGPRALKAAIDAGADAVYFGLKELNARRGAENFTQENLVDNIQYVHERKAKAYLTLNIDISQRELGEAARHLELARQCKVDAVLIKDPALLKMIPCYPELEFHFSTQAGISSSAGVMAARDLGIRRVVLARELSLDEIRAASSVEGVDTEVFVQGALCFSVSGRCLLSSWIGGRSGNRGLCASPCRFEWKIGDSGAGRFLSMHDLSLLEKLDDLKQAGVRALKIEGRLKSPDWVSKAVQVYRRAIDSGVDEELRKEVIALGEYTGRKFTDAYLGSCRSGLTGESGRIAKPDEDQAEAIEDNKQSVPEEEGYGIELKSEGGKLACVFTSGGISKKYLYPVSLVGPHGKTVSLAGISEAFSEELIQGQFLSKFTADNPEMLMTRNILKKIREDLSSFLHLAKKKTDDKIKIKLPVDVQQILDLAKTDLVAGPNRKQFNGTLDLVRIRGYGNACEFRRKNPGCGIIADDISAADLRVSDFNWGNPPPVIALPPVFYENDISQLKTLLETCKAKKFTLEVNSWDGWFLAKDAGLKFNAGPGLAILNSMAAGFLHDKGCGSVVISSEADSQQAREMAPKSPVPLILYVYGRPVLMMSRVEFPQEFYGRIFRERRNCSMKLEKEWNLSVFRPDLPFDLRNNTKGNIAVADFAADLSGELKIEDGLPYTDEPKTFNYLRKLR
ncbi:MAG: hypothetical protein A2X48_12730 [Lentisphaerae bacterium GWF2_49_21]|nr:MAG: hypothetical protein A2X48_12730 [Lentisphaerae bacterium GWF2_49_21]